MEQAFSADVLVPLGVGAAALVIAIVIVVVRAARARKRPAATTEPTHADWTGESLDGPEPALVGAPASAPAASSAAPLARSGSRPVTVADMVAVREADTAPLPVQSDVLLARARAHRAAAEEAARQAALAVDPPLAEQKSTTPDAEPARAAESAPVVPQAASPAPHPSPTPRAAQGGSGAPVGDTPPSTPHAPDAEPVADGSPDVTADVSREVPTEGTAPADERPSAAQLAALGAAGAAGAAGLAAVAGPTVGAAQSRQAEPADDTGSTEPSEPSEPAGSTRSVENTGSAEPTENTGSAEPSELTVSAESGEPAEHPRSAEHGEPTVSAESAAPSESAGSSEPSEPAGSSEPSEPTTPAEDQGPAATDKPEASTPDPDRTPTPDAAGDASAATPARAWPVVSPRADEDRTGSSPAVANAVQQALAARARAAQAGQAVDPRRGDARDRLLAVLLDDPVRAVGAAVDLQSQQEELARIAEAMRVQRAELGAVVRRLADAGLSCDQVARLAGLEPGEVTELLGDPR